MQADAAVQRQDLVRPQETGEQQGIVVGHPQVPTGDAQNGGSSDLHLEVMVGQQKWGQKWGPGDDFGTCPDDRFQL